MLRFSFPIGRIMGVDVRLHLSFFLLLLAATAYGAACGAVWRGLGLFAALGFAVVVREVARSIAAAYIGLRLRALFLLPVGGVMAFSPPEDGAQPSTLPLLLTAPIANFAMGLLMLGLSYACDRNVDLLAQPWISPAHVLRSFVWMQFVLGVVNLLPTATLPTRQMLGGSSNERGSGPAFGLLAGVATAAVLGGLIIANLWLVILGCFTLLASQLYPVAPKASTETPVGDKMRVEDVMLTEYTLLSSSDTLRGALDRTVHSLQDVFPIVRGERLVGSVSRQTIAEHLLIEGDSYVQGVMTKNMQIAEPHEEIGTALRRAASRGAADFVPVAENGRMLGILTSQNLPRAMHQVRQTRPPVEPKERR